MLMRIRPPGRGPFSNMVHWYPSGIRSFATVSDEGPAPMSATFFPFFATGICGSRSVMSSL